METKQVKSINSGIAGKASKADIGSVLYTVTGVATGWGTFNSKFGAQKFLKGDFLAVLAKGPDAGKVVISNAAFLPGEVVNMAIERLNGGQHEVDLTVGVGVAESDKNSSGIAYIAVEPMTKERKSRQAELLARANKLATATLEFKGEAIPVGENQPA